MRILPGGTTVLILILVVVVSSSVSVNALSSPSTPPANQPFAIAPTDHPEKLPPLGRRPFQRRSISRDYAILQENVLEEAAASSSSSNSVPWTSGNYLKAHQRVKKRKSFRRLVEIAQILAGQVFRPLVCSLIQDFRLLRSSEEWDEFWTKTATPALSSHSSSSKRFNYTNAERIVAGLPQLGPTYLKLAQIAATRPDLVPIPLAEALQKVQHDLPPFDNLTAKRIIRRDIQAAMSRARRKNRLDDDFPIQTQAELKDFLDSISAQPKAAASVAQVYKAHLKGFGDVAIKVQRVGIRKKVERDATLFHSVAAFLESLKWPKGFPLQGQPLIGNTKLVQTVDEFTARVFEDMDFRKEAENILLFGTMYNDDDQVHVPKLIPDLCSSRIIVMEWLEGTRLTDIDCNNEDKDPELERQENLRLVVKAIECNLSQFMEFGMLHAEPTIGNVLKVREESSSTAWRKNQNGSETSTAALGYLDFGLISSVPQQVRDGVVLGTVNLVFAYNIDAVADLCVDLGLLPASKIQHPKDRRKLIQALQTAFDSILIWPKDRKGRTSAVPKVRFENLLFALSKLISEYGFNVPPYGLNNARSLATLEGIALKLDPEFNILRVIYPYSINHLMRNPSVSAKTQEAFLGVCDNPETRLVDLKKFRRLLNDWSIFTGYHKRRILWDLTWSAGTRRVFARIVFEWLRRRVHDALILPKLLIDSMAVALGLSSLEQRVSARQIYAASY